MNVVQDNSQLFVLLIYFAGKILGLGDPILIQLLAIKNRLNTI